jgi:MOSC domain-containing protein YiiM
MAVLEVTGTEGVPHRMHQPKRHIVYDIMPRGLLARVVTGGMVRKGDQVVILSLGRKTANPV